MPADDPAGLGEPGRRELRPGPGLVRDPPGFRESLQHPRDRRGTHGEARRDVGRGDPLVRAAERMDRLQVILEENPDIAAEVGKRKRENQILVGFAAESDELIENAISKLNRKNMDMIVANDITAKGSGFESDTNSVAIICKNGHMTKIEGTKEEVAWRLWDVIEMKFLAKEDVR